MNSRKLKYTKVLMMLGVLLLASPTFSQVETYEDCFSKKNNADLKNLNKKQKGAAVDGVFYTSGANIPAAGMTWQTSFKPHKSVSKSRPKNMSQNEWAEETCGLNAYRVQDNREATRWCEGVSGSGIGEVVVGFVGLENKNYFYILPGVNGLRKNYESYSRPSEIVVHYLLPGKYDISQAGGKILGEVIYWNKQTVKLNAEPGYQKIVIQGYDEIVKEVKKYNLRYPLILVAIEIRSVIEGKENKEHTCIAEIGNSEEDAFYKKATLRD